MSDDSICPICKDYLVEPRIYECGHTICESCMIKSDKTVKENTLNTFQLPVYKCCLCRHETLKEWFRRPINHNLQCILMKDDEYKQAFEIYKKNKDKEDPEDDTIPQRVNLSRIVTRKRRQKCDQIYKEILPSLVNAALEGKPYITITTNVKDISV